MCAMNSALRLRPRKSWLRRLQILGVCLLTMSCVSCRTTEYVVPEITFPEFPIVDTYSISDDGTQVTVDAEFMRELLIYKREIATTEELYNEKRKIYNDRSK